ncbi:MAG: thioredoxin family protein [Armatimonadetes bacterium]|nr:thioredoxin family protein [Armatimonadota bacterium]
MATAQPKSPVSWTATLEPTPARPGEVVVLRLEATIGAPWHIYGTDKVEGPVATSFALAAASPLTTDGGLLQSEPKRKHDEAFGVEVTYHEGTVTLRQPLRLPRSARPGDLTVAGTVRFQACTDKSCLPPAKAPISVPLKVEAGAVRAEYAKPPVAPKTVAPPAPTRKPAAATSTEGTADVARRAGLLRFLLVAFLAGLAALLTPCVFPMIPITVSFFTKQAGDNPRKRVSLALFYGAGIMVMYTGLGLVMAATMGATGAQRVAANPFVNLFFAALFIFFSISLFGYFELQLPSGLVNRSSRMGSAGGYLGALFMGLTLTLAAFTCTVQFVGGVLVWAANGEWVWPILGMVSFSTAFAAPFVLLALFPQYLASMPRSGGWLHHTKVVLAFIEVGAALKFISNADLVWQWKVLSRELVLGSWSALCFLTAVYLWGRLRIADGDCPDRVSRGRRTLAGVFALLCVYLAWGLTGARLQSTAEALLPPAGYGRGAQAAETAWTTDYDVGLAKARESGQVALVDYTGVTCTNCRWMEQNMFPKPAVAQRLAKMTLIRLYTDQGDRAEQYRDMQVANYKTISLPFYAVVAPDGTTLATFDGMTRDEAAFVAFLDKGLAGGK